MALITLNSWIARGVLLMACIATIVSCQHHAPQSDGPPPYAVDISHIHNPTPHPLAFSKTGNPTYYVANGKTYHVLPSARNYVKRGIASWYGAKFHGHRTSSGETYDMLAMTAASPELPIPCFARVTNLRNGRSVIVKVNDRGPFAQNRILDLSYAAAKKLGYAEIGTAPVIVKTITEFANAPQFASTLPVAQTAGQSHQPHLYLQLGAYRIFAHAQTLKQKLQALIKEKITIRRSYASGSTIYRVQIGPLASINQSDLLYSKLKKLGFNDAITIIG